MGWIALGLSAALIYGAMAYNRLVRGRIHVGEGWSGIDVQLKRRHDLIPNLVEVVRGYMQHERDLLERVSQLRAQAAGAGNVGEKAGWENDISRTLKTIFAVAEAYPQLKADRNFLDLQKNLVALEEEIQLARRYYNGTVRNYNVAVQTFPNNLVAGMFAFRPAEFFQLDSDDERAAPPAAV